MIIKPSEFTPASSVRLAQLAHEAGLPAGVFNVAAGLGQTVGAALTTDRRVGKVSFIGSVPTGRRVAVAAAQAGIPALLELGGKSANIVFADADLDRAADGAISAIFSGAGQSCVAGSRLLVERSVHAQFVELVAGPGRAAARRRPAERGHRGGPHHHGPAVRHRHLPDRGRNARRRTPGHRRPRFRMPWPGPRWPAGTG